LFRCDWGSGADKRPKSIGFRLSKGSRFDQSVFSTMSNRAQAA
jgi:hypothetical protein